MKVFYLHKYNNDFDDQYKFVVGSRLKECLRMRGVCEVTLCHFRNLRVNLRQLVSHRDQSASF